ncbi:MAG: hypothetical protein GTO05_03020, partial [Gemmatimonadales bacterium]|nr:hypothetical protein [Gemmatimonadales bacterium]
MESHLRDQIADLTDRGLDDDEAFIIAVRRIGSIDEISHEFALEHSDRLWKQLLVSPGTAVRPLGRLRTMLGFAVLAAAIVAVFQLTVDIDELPNLWIKTVPLLVLAVLAGYL